MARTPFASFAHNGEDVVLWRALRGVVEGRYIEVHAYPPRSDSVTQAFYDHGWHGIIIEPEPELADRFRHERPGDLVFQVPAALRKGASTALDDLVDGAGWAGKDVHFLSIDAKSGQTEVLQSIDLQTWRPWVIVARSETCGNTRSTHEQWAEFVRSADYRLCLFDGLSRFYVAAERNDEIGAALSVPANIGDNFTTVPQRTMLQELEDARAQRKEAITQSIQWRSVALERWSDLMENTSTAAGRLSDENQRLQREFVALQSTLSWRVTRPLRSIRERFPRDQEEE